MVTVTITVGMELLNTLSLNVGIASLCVRLASGPTTCIVPILDTLPTLAELLTSHNLLVAN